MKLKLAQSLDLGVIEPPCTHVGIMSIEIQPDLALARLCFRHGHFLPDKKTWRWCGLVCQLTQRFENIAGADWEALAKHKDKSKNNSAVEDVWWWLYTWALQKGIFTGEIE